MPKKRRDKIDWLMIKEQWMESHIQKKPMNFRELSESNGISWQQVRQRASNEKWPEQLEKRLAVYDHEVARRLGAAASAVTDKLQNEFIGNEIEIRRRHAQVARGIQGKALQRISTMDLGDMKLSDCIQLLKLGMEEERKAMGMPNDYVAPAETGKVHPEFRSVQDHERDHAKIARAAAGVLQALRDAASAAKLPSPTGDDLQDAQDALGVLGATDVTPAGQSPVLVIAKQPEAA